MSPRSTRREWRELAAVAMRRETLLPGRSALVLLCGVDPVCCRLERLLDRARLLGDHLLRGRYESGGDVHRCRLDLRIRRDALSERLQRRGKVIERFLQFG